MDKQTITNRLDELKENLNILVDKIEVERQESKDDEQSVLNELLGNKSIVEDEIFNLESALNLLNIEKTKAKLYILESRKKRIQISIVPETLVDNAKGFISKESPLAQAIIKAGVGDTFKIATPAGELEYKLIEISKHK